jgi:CubicO group peptidase (beta-lactamase class C family)
MPGFFKKAALALSLCSTAGCITGLFVKEPPDALDEFIQKEMEKKQIPGLAFSVVRYGDVLMTRTYGLANLETGTPVTTSSVFELASLTKPFTATAVMLLVQDGRVSLEDPITKYIDGSPDDWKAVRVRHLLTHTAGFGEQSIVERQGLPVMDVSTKQQFDLIRQTPRLFPAGQKAAYSDPGYFLLGMIIEKASGLPYAQFMEERIFKPLGMTGTSVLDQSRIIKNRVSPYTINGEGVLRRGRRDIQHELPSFFGVYSTIDDMIKWEKSLVEGTLLPKALLDTMWTPALLNDGSVAQVDGQPYGFGWELGEVRYHRGIGHGGFTGTFMQRLPDDGLTVIVLTNLDLVSGNAPNMIARGLAGLISPKYLPFHMVEPQPDPDPKMSELIRGFVTDYGGEKSLEMLTPMRKVKFLEAPEQTRKDVAAVWKTTSSLTYVTGEDITGSGVQRLGASVVRIVYYKAENDRESRLFTFWMAGEGKIADFTSYRF